MRSQPQPARGRRLLTLQVWRNPLARRTDRAEAVLVLVLVASWLVALPVVATISSVRWSDASANAAAQQQSLTPVVAVVERNATVPIGAADAAPVWITAPVSWAGADGQPVTADVEVPATVDVGDQVKIWLDRSGRIVPQPPGPEALAGLAVLTGAGTWLLAGLLLLLVGWIARRRLDRARLRAWQREWAEVEPGRHPF